MTAKEGYPNESLAIARHRRLPVVRDFDFVPDDSAGVTDELLRRAAHGPVWADPSPTDYGVAPPPPARRSRRVAATQPAEAIAEPLTHRCTSCGASVTTAQSLLPRCPSCGAGAT